MDEYIWDKSRPPFEQYVEIVELVSAGKKLVLQDYHRSRDALYKQIQMRCGYTIRTALVPNTDWIVVY